MQFITRKRRQAPAVIIISLIDILIVLLIFLMVTTSFRQVPSLKINLPQSTSAPKEGSSSVPRLIVTIDKTAPYLYLNTKPVTLSKLQDELNAASVQDSNIVMAVRADKEAPIQELMDVMSAATTARIRSQISVYTRQKSN